VRGWAGDLARGLDPKEHNKKQETDQKHSLSMEAFLRLYIEKYKKIHNKQNTVKNDMYKINNVIIPFFKEKKFWDVSEEDIIRFQEHLKNTPIQFNRCKSILSKAFSLAELWGYRPKNSNPCRGIQKYPEKKKERFLTAEELERLDTSYALLRFRWSS
jgi:integrase